ncbi:MAG: hypothetical protein NTW86_04495 [Candidatus Sumerlaeota bacterium]|nr:hypothetical protein [Candidatus Sumerlaeota bacterium]
MGETSSEPKAPSDESKEAEAFAAEQRAPSIWPMVATILGIAAVVAIAIKPSKIEVVAQGRPLVSRVKSDQRLVASALEIYYIDNNCSPAWATGTMGVNAFAPADSHAFQALTFRAFPRNRQMMTLTTPVAYLSSYIPDPYADLPGAVGAYYTDPEALGWILYSEGPDFDYDIDPAKDYNPKQPMPGEALIRKSYDPTNGTPSDGDIFRVKQ